MIKHFMKTGSPIQIKQIPGSILQTSVQRYNPGHYRGIFCFFMLLTQYGEAQAGSKNSCQCTLLGKEE